MRNIVQLCLTANNVLLIRKWNHAFFLLAIALAWKWQFFSQIIKKIKRLGHRMIKQLLNSVIAKNRDLSVSCRLIICLSLRLRQIIDLLTTDKSRYFCSTSSNKCWIFILWMKVLKRLCQEDTAISGQFWDHFTFLGNCPLTPPLNQD